MSRMFDTSPAPILLEVVPATYICPRCNVGGKLLYRAPTRDTVLCFPCTTKVPEVENLWYMAIPDADGSYLSPVVIHHHLWVMDQWREVIRRAGSPTI